MEVPNRGRGIDKAASWVRRAWRRTCESFFPPCDLSAERIALRHSARPLGIGRSDPFRRPKETYSDECLIEPLLHQERRRGFARTETRDDGRGAPV